VLVRFTDRDGSGEDLTVISDDFPVSAQNKAGYNINGNIHFGPDAMLYLSMGDYDYGADNSLVQDLASPIGKLLRIDPATGEAPADNPFADNAEADPRVFAYGFREPFDFAFDPKSEAIYGTDNTTVTCEELNIIRAGQDYGWPDVGGFPFGDCEFGDQVRAIHFFTREGKQRGEFISFVEVVGLAFAPGSRYPVLGDSLFVCEGHRSPIDGKTSPGVLRRIVFAGDSQIAADDLIVKDCKGDVETSPDGTVYYSTATQILRLLPPTPTGAASEPAAASPTR
jgi:glucose/arabinose dehydrogenase